MSGGNGADMGHVIAMLGDVLSIQREMRAEMHGSRAEVHELRRRVDDLDGKVDGLRQAVTAYHASVLGHGVLIGELDARLRRVELDQHAPVVADVGEAVVQKQPVGGLVQIPALLLGPSVIRWVRSRPA